MPVRKVTARVLAEDLGVSRATVSNAYNRPEQLSAALRARILERAAELGFAGPDPIARGLRRGRVGAIGVLIDRSVSHAFSDPVAVLVLDGLAQALQTEGFGLLLHAASTGPDDEQLVRDAAVDGWVLMSIPAHHAAVAAALAQSRPLVVLDQPALPDVPLVTIDDTGGARAAAEHLLGLGHRRIALLTPPLDDDGRTGVADLDRQATAPNAVLAARLSAASATLREAGIDDTAVQVVECSANDEAAGQAGAALLLDGVERPSAVLALSDRLALGTLRCARERRLSVPNCLSIVGFDDAPPGRTSSPPLTTVAQPLEERGREAGRLMLAQLRGEPAVARPPFPTHLVVRGSTARALRS